MRIKLLAPFRIRGFLLKSEALVVSPDEYSAFWDGVASRLGGPVALPAGPARDLVRFAHASAFEGSGMNRYATIDAASLVRPLHVLEICVPATALRFAAHVEEYLAREKLADLGAGDAWDRVVSGYERLVRLEPEALVRVYDHGIGILELDLPLGRLLFEAPTRRTELERALDALQGLVVHVGAKLVEELGHALLGPLFREIGGCDGAPAFVALAPPVTRVDGVADATPVAEVLWSSRTLLFEPSDVPLEDPEANARSRREAIVRHWLKDVRGDGREAAEALDRSADASSLEWLNYAFREGAGSEDEPYPQRGWRTERGLAKAFCDEWTAMIQAQFYYAAFDVLQSAIYEVLADALSEDPGRDLAALKRRLDAIVKRATLLRLDYYENQKLYERDVAFHMREILDGWQLETVLAQQVEKGIESCNRRIEALHENASERSALYTDVILLGIGITSVFGILLAMMEQGRSTATNAALAAYERGYLNVVDWLASRSSDGMLLVGTVVSGALILLYWRFKSRSIL